MGRLLSGEQNHSNPVTAQDFTCSGGDSCVVDPQNHAIGCCPPTEVDSCVIQTACTELDPESNLPPKGRRDTSRTLVCGGGLQPSCLTYMYATDDMTFGGYSAFSCDSKNTVITVSINRGGDSASTTDKSTSTTTDDSTTTNDSTTVTKGSSTANSAPSSSHASPTGLDSGSTSERPTQSSGPPNVGIPEPVDDNHQLPTGTIAGSVVGGVAGVALVAAAIVFLVLRSRKKNKEEEKRAEKPAATVPGPTSDDHGDGKELFLPMTAPPMAAPPMEGATYPIAGQQPARHSPGPISPTSHHTCSSGVPEIHHPVSPVQEDETASTREGHGKPAGETGGRMYSIHNRPPSSRYQAYNPVSGGPAELPATTVHEME